MGSISFEKIKHLFTLPKFFFNRAKPQGHDLARGLAASAATPSLQGTRVSRAKALVAHVPAHPGPREVTFEMYEIHAQAIAVAGTFNNWNPRLNPMRNTGKGKWVATLLLAPGKHEYRFVVDGHWKEDPLAQETVPNPFGGVNSVMVV